MADPVWTDGVTDLNAANMVKLQTRDEKNAVSGYAGLDSSGYLALASTQQIVWAADTNLYRVGAGEMQTDGDFSTLTGAIYAQENWVGANYTQAGRVRIGAVGPSGAAAVVFGSAGDGSIWRVSSSALKATGDFISGGNMAALYGDAAQVLFGDIGGSVPGIIFGNFSDTNLYRSAADTLKSDDGFVASGGLVTKTKAGVPSDSDLVTGMQQSGAMILDTTNSRVYFRVGSTWKYAALT